VSPKTSVFSDVPEQSGTACGETVSLDRGRLKASVTGGSGCREALVPRVLLAMNDAQNATVLLGYVGLRNATHPLLG